MKTSTIHHHISEPLLLEYAAGTLEEGWSLAVATHLALCPHCRQQLRLMEAAGATMLEELAPEPAAISEDHSWNALLARLNDAHAEPQQPPRPEPVAETALLVPEPLRSYIGGSLESVQWRRLGLNAHQAILQPDGGAVQARLLRVGPGQPLPEHSHGGRELTLVLKGSYISEGQLFAAGDLEEEDDETLHSPVVTGDGECICLVVTDAPLRFQSRLMRMVQPLLGI
ncbi:ChrR family anti-sigma-E factor [Martelella limonii]|uniref:ChrR family anti-sigma-E factor n=1 Tax=Martelella limonii TaxID=1647649 RepID=UPI001581227C|nr:ChrR family anti-sigma-E factor [Martelella limonii]